MNERSPPRAHARARKKGQLLCKAWQSNGSDGPRYKTSKGREARAREIHSKKPQVYEYSAVNISNEEVA